MNIKLFATVFVTIFLAEIADKTQIATLLYASNSQNNKLVIFLGASLALCLASAIAVFIGSLLSSWIDGKILGKLAGIAFIMIGVWTFFNS